MTLIEARGCMASRALVTTDNGPPSAHLVGTLDRERRMPERLPEPGESCGESAGYDFRLHGADGRCRWLPAGHLVRWTA